MSILCLASSKLGLYALPVFPALALITARLRPEIQNTTLPVFDKKTLVFLSVWSVALLSSRFVLAKLPTENNCSTLWNELQSHIPPGDYEIVAIDKRIDGLLFYKMIEIETITRRDNPYPTYMRKETIGEEIEDMQNDNYPHLFILESSKNLEQVRQMLLNADWTVQEIPLKYKRVLLFCEPR